MNLFAYGTLMVDEIMAEVCAQSVAGERALLRNFSRRAVHEQPFPALIAAAGEQVWGVLYRDLNDASVARLDRFEGEMYARHPVQVQLAAAPQADTGADADAGAAARVDAQVYVVEPAYHQLVSEQAWDYERFLQSGRQRFESGYRGYRAL